MNDSRFRNAVEAALLAAGKPLALDDLLAVFAETDWQVERAGMRAALAELVELWQDRGLELVEVASGWRFQVRREYSGALGRLWSDKPPRYSRALLETLAIIAYRQPVTRGEIEDIRGVAVSPSILKTLHEREWIRTLGHKEVPGRPELLGTTRQFLDDLGLANLESLPPLSEIRDLDAMPDDLFPETRPGALPVVAALPAGLDGEAAPAADKSGADAAPGREPFDRQPREENDPDAHDEGEATNRLDERGTQREDARAPEQPYTEQERRHGPPPEDPA